MSRFVRASKYRYVDLSRIFTSLNVSLATFSDKQLKKNTATITSRSLPAPGIPISSPHPQYVPFTPSMSNPFDLSTALYQYQLVCIRWWCICHTSPSIPIWSIYTRRTFKTPRYHSPRPHPHSSRSRHCLVPCKRHPRRFRLRRWHLSPLESLRQPL